MSTKITKGLAAIALVGVLSGGLAACGSSARHRARGEAVDIRHGVGPGHDGPR
jgi:hypothetical protein